MGGPTYSFPRGQPVIIGRRVLAGDPAGFMLFADIKAVRSPGAVPPAAQAAAASFAVQFVPATGLAAAHWLLVFAAELPAGLYCSDPRFELAEQVALIGQPCWIRITESVSG